MSCDRFKTRLLDFALGAEDAELRAHVDACPACRAKLDAHRALVNSIDRGVASIVAAEPSGDFAAHVRSRIAEQALAPRPWFAGWLPATVAAMALLVLVTFWMFRREDATPEKAIVTPPMHNSRPPREPQSAQNAPTIPAPTNTGGPQKIRPPRPPQSATNREPEVLVPRGEMAAVMRLFNSNWNGKADGATLMAAVAPTAELLKPLTTLELNISPLQIELLEEEGKSKGSTENL